MSKKPLKISWRSWCLYKLAVRDYSAYEMARLMEKRAAASGDTVDAAPVVEQLVSEGSIDDSRYIKNQISLLSNGNNAKGPREIRRKLSKKGGIPGEQLDQFLDENDKKWFDLANAVKNQTLAAKGFSSGDSSAIPEKIYHNLRQKLFRNGFTKEQIHSAMAGLVPQARGEKDLDSDDINRQIERLKQSGKGPLAILHQLKQKGVEEPQVREKIDFYDDAWIDLAKAQLEKRFGQPKGLTKKERKKQSDFLLRRGFLFDQIREVFDD